MKKILFISTSRADYGLLKEVIIETQKLNRETFLLISGSHLSKEFGNLQERLGLPSAQTAEEASENSGRCTREIAEPCWAGVSENVFERAAPSAADPENRKHSTSSWRSRATTKKMMS